MSLAPIFKGHRLGAVTAPNTLEVYLDYVCPFSAKIFKKLQDEVLPWIEQAYPGQVQFLFRQQIQPWHASSTLVHEAAIAVEKIAPEQFFPTSRLLFERQQDYFDEAVEEKTRRQLVDQVAELIASNLGSDKVTKQSLVDLLNNGTGDPQNKGNAVTNDLKWHIRFSRQSGIHVSPTVVWNGIRDDGVSSGWSLDQWQTYLQSKL
ncbi:hypothetical protein DM01DRAFT_1319357 [Hesseltinella vesiculosa]|uniref:Thioredoxin-like fold domain-containing protein n=1 Tax=Hesseltinella vesiculosa TaxID=101127 RepID=A0A1X2GMW7_9FUNG|nr:hypothetical protein DM01DRAFT_1319357 [Hesseltinella vesiculosa]